MTKKSLEERVSALEDALNETNRIVARMILHEGKEEARLDEVAKAHNELVEVLSYKPSSVLEDSKPKTQLTIVQRNSLRVAVPKEEAKTQ